MEKVNLGQKLARIADHWNPRIVGELNGQQVKLNTGNLRTSRTRDELERI